MTGLNKIIERISQDSVAKCDGIIFSAQTEAAEIKSAAEKEGEADKKAIIEAANKQADSMVDMAKSGADLLIRQSLLSTKIDIINEAINAATDKLKNLPDNEYFDAIYALVKKFSQDSDGTLLLSKKDLDRKPKDFDQKIAQINKKLNVSDKAATISDGFVLVYGEIEINCTFDALVEDSRDELKEIINEIIFA